MEEHILVDITAAIEYANKMIEEKTKMLKCLEKNGTTAIWRFMDVN